jgi:phosphate transport system substrate-binding protein
MSLPKRITVIILLLAIVFTSCNNERNGQKKQKISISGAFALYPLVIKWSEEFKKTHPDVEFEISAGGAGKGMSDVLGGMIDIAMISREINSQEIHKGAFKVSVAVDAVVPTISEFNPNINEILTKGITKEILGKIYITGEIKNWSEAKFSKSGPIHIYTRSDASGSADVWAKFVGEKVQEDLNGIGVFGDPSLMQAVRNDRYSIGYNNFNYTFDSKTGKNLKGLRILPIDLNGNGKIDKEENFYNTLSDLKKAISNGSYPKPPARDLYLVTKGNSKRPIVNEFMKWILTEGQQYVAEIDYINLDSATVKSELKKIQ